MRQTKLIEREQYYIDLCDSYNNGYNSTPKAGNSLGRKCSNETRNKISESNKGKHPHANGRKLSDVTKEKLRKINIGKKSGDKHHMFDKTHSEETKNKIRKSLIGRFIGDKHPNFGKKLFEGRENPNYNPTPILQYDLNNNFIKEWSDLISLKEAGFNSKLVSRVCRKLNKAHLGFDWKYKITIF